MRMSTKTRWSLISRVSWALSLLIFLMVEWILNENQSICILFLGTFSSWQAPLFSSAWFLIFQVKLSSPGALGSWVHQTSLQAEVYFARLGLVGVGSSACEATGLQNDRICLSELCETSGMLFCLWFDPVQFHPQCYGHLLNPFLSEQDQVNFKRCTGTLKGWQ